MSRFTSTISSTFLNLLRMSTSTIQSINVYPCLATWKKNKAGESPIHISIDIDGKRAAFPSIKKKVKPVEWDSDGRKVKNSNLAASVINALIKVKVSEYEREFTAKQLQGVKVTRQSVKKQVKGQDTGQDFYKFCRNQITVGDYADSTRKNYRGEVTKLEAYSATLTFKEINYQWLQEWSNYMRSDLDNQDNTVWKSLKFLNTMMHQAMKIGGIVAENPFKEFSRGRYKQGIPTYLEWVEVQKLHESIKTGALSDEHRLVGYYSLLSYYSGLRFGDAVKFRYSDKVIEDSTGKRLVLYAQKNGEIVSIAFNKYIEEVTEYIRDKPLKIDNQTFNEGLDVIRGVSKIRKKITSHTGRHSFGMRCAELDISIERTQKLMGHIQQKSTAIYYRVKNKSLDDEMQKW
jgi:site-specific recombinase XerD